MVTDRANRADGDEVWPISLNGIEIGKLQGVCELAVHTKPDIIIWAFTQSARCKTWRLRKYADSNILSKFYVCHSGVMHSDGRLDEDGDVIMEDGSSIRPTHIDSGVRSQEQDDGYMKVERSVILGLDGSEFGILGSFSKALAVENDEWVFCINVGKCSDAWYDGDGNVFARYGT